jgi:hypothetical protein
MATRRMDNRQRAIDIFAETAKGNGKPFMPALADDVARRILADGDTVAAEARGRSLTVAGAAYENKSCWIIDVERGQMQSIVECADTAPMQSVLGPCPAWPTVARSRNCAKSSRT